MDVDKAGQNRKAAPVDLDRIGMVGRLGGADRSDRVPFDRQVDIAPINMGLRPLVPGDEPGGVADKPPRWCWLERLRHGIEANSARHSSGGRLRFENLVARGKCDPWLLAAGPNVPGRPQP